MPVQKSRKTPSKRGMHRSHDRLAIRSRVRRTSVTASRPMVSIVASA